MNTLRVLAGHSIQRHNISTNQLYGKLCNQGFGLIELLIALFISSIAILASISLLTTLLTNWQGYTHSQQLANSAFSLSNKLRQGVGLSGYKATGDAIHIRGLPPTTELDIRYSIDSNSIYNLYDCTRSQMTGERVNTWRVRQSRFDSPTEMVCRGSVLDIIDSNTIGMDAYGLSHSGTIAHQQGDWRMHSQGHPHAVALQLLLQHPQDTFKKSPRATPFSWQGIGENTKANYVWLQLLLARRID